MCFDDRVLVLPPVDEGNHIVFGLSGPRMDEPMAVVARRARSLEARWRLPVARWLQDLREANGLGDPLRYDTTLIIDGFSRPYVT